MSDVATASPLKGKAKHQSKTFTAVKKKLVMGFDQIMRGIV
jgi:hypothetical protein